MEAHLTYLEDLAVKIILAIDCGGRFPKITEGWASMGRLAICEGPIDAIVKAYRDGREVPLGDGGLTPRLSNGNWWLARLGTADQPPFNYISIPVDRRHAYAYVAEFIGFRISPTARFPKLSSWCEGSRVRSDRTTAAPPRC